MRPKASRTVGRSWRATGPLGRCGRSRSPRSAEGDTRGTLRLRPGNGLPQLTGRAPGSAGARCLGDAEVGGLDARTSEPTERNPHHGRLRRCRRPGHHQHPIHDLRPRRQRGGPPPARARADPAAGRLGRAQPGRDLGAHVVRHRRPRSTTPACGAATSSRSASPTSARPPSSGTGAPAGRSTTPSSGRTPAPTASPPRWSATAAATSSGARPGLPPATYFSGGKIQWILENVDGARAAAERGDAIFGNTDTWLLWNLTGGVDGGVHVTDVDQRQPHDADGPRDARLGRRAARLLRHPARDAARDPAVARYADRLRRHRWPTGRSAASCRSPATSATSRPPPSARSASPPARPRTPTAPATSCCSTPARSWCARSTAC